MIPSPPPQPSPPSSCGQTHILATVLAGLLSGQLADQQGLHELAHKIKVAVEGQEGVLESRGQVVSTSTPTPASASTPGRAGLASRSSVPLGQQGTKRGIRDPTPSVLGASSWQVPRRWIPMEMPLAAAL